MTEREFTHPGRLLLHHFMEPRGMDACGLAKLASRSADEISAVIEGTADIDEGLANSLSSIFGTSAQLWLNAQHAYQLTKSDGANEADTQHTFQYELKPIRNEQDHAAALADVDALMSLDPTPGTPEFDRLELLAMIVDHYEREAVPEDDAPDVYAWIRFHMEQNNLDIEDLGSLLDDVGRAKVILSSAAPLTLSEMRILHKEWGIPASVLIQDDL
ncbi:MAG: HigA family addiction module antidote protein [Oricola sp.]|nr:HigA family addiction module antidote protein [Oricola sp.]